MIINKYHLRYPLNEEVLMINTLTGAVDFFSHDLINFIDTLSYRDYKNLTNEEKNATKILIDRGYVFKNTEDRDHRLWQAKNIVDAGNEMQYVICPTYTCNFRCPYCFESHSLHEKITALTEEQLQAVMQAIDIFHKESGYKIGMINLFGGEPLLPFTKKIVKQICEEAVKRNFKIGCNTNGYHLSSFVEIFQNYRDRLSIMVTVDGPKNIHDQRRIMTGGQGTFDQIQKGICDSLNHGIRTIVRVNIDQTNIDYVSLLVDYYKKNKLFENENFSISFSPVTDHTCKGLGEDLMKGYEIVKKLQKNIPDFEKLEKQKSLNFGADMYCFFKPIMQLDSELKNKIEMVVPNIVYCESAEGKRVVFGPDNHIYACPDLVGRSEFKIGDYFPKFSRQDWKWEKWKQFNSFTIPQCKSCASSPICGGGCAAEALIVHGNLNQPNCPQTDKQVFEYLKTIKEEISI